MKLLELHILQSFPVSCLNRDEVGAPKSATFGGAMRSRLSSQCIKRTIREKAKELEKDRPQQFFKGERTTWAADALEKLLTEPKPEWKLVALADAKNVAQTVCKGFVAKVGKDNDEEKEKKGATKKAGTKAANKAAAQDSASQAVEGPEAETDEEAVSSKTKTLLYLSPGEIELIAKALLQKKASVGNASEKKAAIDAAVAAIVAKTTKDDRKALPARDVADIALFGRMVAQENTVTVEGAGLFNHPLTTHKATNDIDYWTAVDDNAKNDHAGAANLGVSEHTSGVFYRYAAVNLDLLFAHLGEITAVEDRKLIIKTFIEAVLMAIPKARDNSHNAHTEVGYALGFVREHGQPLQLVNAFEEPVQAKKLSGLLAPSVEKMLLHLQTLRADYGTLIEASKEVAFGSYRPAASVDESENGEKLKAILPNSSFESFCDELSQAAVTKPSEATPTRS